MLWQTLDCPRCGAPLPKQARWRMVTCPFCKSTVGLGQQVVQAKDFRLAWQRAQAAAFAVTDRLDLGRQSFRLLDRLDGGDGKTRGATERFLALRLLPSPALVSLRLAAPGAHLELHHEAAVLTELQASTVDGASYFSRRLPLVLTLGPSEGPYAPGHTALALRHPPGAWGSLAAALLKKPDGLEATHVVWMWRRVLETLGFAHDAGWAHGDLSLENLQVHPEDHLVHLTGWGRAARLEPNGDDSLQRPTVHRDLAQSAWAMRQLLEGAGGGTPGFGKAPRSLAALLEAVTGDPDFARGQTARSLREQVGAAARAAFGPPRFVPFHLPAN